MSIFQFYGDTCFISAKNSIKNTPQVHVYSKQFNNTLNYFPPWTDLWFHWRWKLKFEASYENYCIGYLEVKFKLSLSLYKYKYACKKIKINEQKILCKLILF